MSRRLPLLACLLVAIPGWRPAPGQSSAPAARPVYKSPLGVAVDADGARAYVALHTAGAVAVVDLRAGKVLREIAVGKGPHDVALAGKALFVSCEQDDALVRIDLDRLAVSGRWPTGQAPRGVAAFPDAGRVFIACHDEQTVHAIDPATGASQSVALAGWPERVALHRDAMNPRLLALATRPGEALISQVDARPPFWVVHTERLAGVTNAAGLALQERDPAVLLAHQRPRTNVPATQVAQGWVFTNALSPGGLSGGFGGGSSGRGFGGFSGGFHQQGQQGGYAGAQALGFGGGFPGGFYQQGGYAGAQVLDDPARGYADPSDVARLHDRDLAFVACAGADTVLAVRTDKLDRGGLGFYGLASPGGGHKERADDLSRSRRYVAARLATQANPRRLALSGDGRTLVVSNHLADSLTVIDAGRLRVVRHVPLGGPAPDAARRGEVLFHSGRMTFQGQFSCASCHPGGGSDGLAWDLPRDGLGNFVNTRALWGARDTAPYGWHGTSPTLADRVAGTLRTLHQHEPQGSETDDLVAYLETLRLPRPLPRGKADAAALARGKALFEGKGRCSRCHGGENFDDARLHDVGTRVGGDVGDRFDTPSLRGLARTAPYLHHGRAATLEEVFTTHNPGQRHGAAHRLTRAELADLIAYLKSL